MHHLRLRRSGVAGLATLALAWGLVVAPAAAVAPAAHAAAPRTRACPDVQVVWAGGVGADTARRSLERRGQDVAVKTVAGTAAMLVQGDLADISAQGLSHPHFKGWRVHARAAAIAVDRSARRCPEAAIVLGGHSEGAVAAHRATRLLAQRQHRAARRHVGGLWLVGDPLAVTGDGTDLFRFTGLLAGRGPELAGWVRRAGVLDSSCFTSDPLCDAGDQYFLDLASHYDYASYGVGAGAEWVPADARIFVPAIDKAPISVRLDRSLPGGVRATVRRPLPRGLRVSHGRLVGTAPRGRTTVKLWVRGVTVAPAVRRRLTVVLEAAEQAAARGTVLVSRSLSGGPANGEAREPVVSGDGRTVAYVSDATNLVRRAVGEGEHGFVWDARTGRTEIVSLGPDGGLLTTIGGVQVSHDGRVVLFSDGTQVWVRDRDARRSTLVPGVERGSYPTLSSDGRLVTYRDQQTTRRWYVGTGEVADLGGGDGLNAVSANGRFLALVRGNELHIYDTVAGVDTADIPFEISPDCAQGVRAVSDNGDYAVHDVTCGGYGGGGFTALHELPGFRVLVSSGVRTVNADASWLIRQLGDGSIVLRPTAGGGRRFLVRNPALDEADEEYPYAGVAVAGDGRAAAYATSALNILPNAGTGTSRVYYWKAP